MFSSSRSSSSKAFDPHLRGSSARTCSFAPNFLIDNRHHRIRFDNDGALLPELTGDRISIAPVRTRTGDLEPRLISIPVHTVMNAEPLHLLLDSGADMVVLQPSTVPPTTVPKGTKWIADENGRLSSATTFHTRLSVGSDMLQCRGLDRREGLNQLVIDGLLPTGSFSQLYISNHDCFVIFEPRRAHAKRSTKPSKMFCSNISLSLRTPLSDHQQQTRLRHIDLADGPAIKLPWCFVSCATEGRLPTLLRRLRIRSLTSLLELIDVGSFFGPALALFVASSHRLRLPGARVTRHVIRSPSVGRSELSSCSTSTRRAPRSEVGFVPLDLAAFVLVLSFLLIQSLAAGASPYSFERVLIVNEANFISRNLHRRCRDSDCAVDSPRLAIYAPITWTTRCFPIQLSSRKSSRFLYSEISESPNRM